MIAYHGSQEYKDQFVSLLEWHKAQDKIIQGQYWEQGKGCAVGCSINAMAKISGKRLNHQAHALYEEYIGVPRILARLEDGIFEGLPVSASLDWPIRFAAAIRPGADLALVWPRFAVWLLVDSKNGVIRFAKTDKQREVIQRVADLYLRKIEGVDVSIGDWISAKHDAADAAADAADAAAAAAAAADAAAYAADAAYAAAAAAAADAAAYAAAYSTRQQARIRQADKLIALLGTTQ